MSRSAASDAYFDAHAEGYHEVLNRWLAVSGENTDHFARARVSWLRARLDRLGFSSISILDYGCGTGGAILPLVEILGARYVVGMDVSRRSLAIAMERNGHEPCEYATPDEYVPRAKLDLAFSNGVFHHIPPADRPAAASYISRCLRAGGLFALWENNPLNPGTRYLMSRVPFDRDAIPLTSRDSRTLLRSAGFEVLRTDYCFIFPRRLRSLRWLEPCLCQLPFGAQYMVLCRKVER